MLGLTDSLGQLSEKTIGPKVAFAGLVLTTNKNASFLLKKGWMERISPSFNTAHQKKQAEAWKKGAEEDHAAEGA